MLIQYKNFTVILFNFTPLTLSGPEGVVSKCATLRELASFDTFFFALQAYAVAKAMAHVTKNTQDEWL